MTLAEFADWLTDAVEGFSLVAVLYRGPQIPLQMWNGHADELAAASRVYIATGIPDLDNIRSDRLNPGEQGWVQVDVPRIAGNSLIGIQIGAKSDWWDAQHSKAMDDPRSIKLFEKLWRQLRKRISFPIWAKNRITNAEASYRTVGYSEGAKEWTQDGGTLVQEGVTNIIYEIRD